MVSVGIFLLALGAVGLAACDLFIYPFLQRLIVTLVSTVVCCLGVLLLLLKPTAWQPDDLPPDAP